MKYILKLKKNPRFFKNTYFEEQLKITAQDCRYHLIILKSVSS